MTPHVAQDGEFGFGLDALAQRRNFEFREHIQQVAHDNPAGLIGIDAPDQRHVELDDVGPETGEKLEPGAARTEIVDGRAETDLAIGLEDPQEVLGVERFVLGEFENNAVGRKADARRRVQRLPYAGARLVHGVGQKVDRQAHVAGWRKQPRRQFYGLDAAALVEGVAALVVDGAEHARGALAVRTAHQRLVTKNAVGGDVDDRLKSHRERRRKCFAIAAAIAPLGHRHPPVRSPTIAGWGLGVGKEPAGGGEALMLSAPKG